MLAVEIPDDDDARTATTDGAPTSEDCEISPLSCFVAITGPPSSESTPTNVIDTFENIPKQAHISADPEIQTLSPTEVNIDYDYIPLINTLHKAFTNKRYDYTSTLMQHIQKISCDNAKKVYCKLYMLIDDNIDRKKTVIDDDIDYLFMNTLTPDEIKQFVNRYINVGMFFEYLAEACTATPMNRLEIWYERENTRVSERTSFQEIATKAVGELILQNKYRNHMKLIYKLYQFTSIKYIDDIETIIRSNSKKLLKKPPGFWNTISFSNHTYYRLSALSYKILKLFKKHGRSLISRPNHERCLENIKQMALQPINKRRIVYDFWKGNLK